MGSGHGERGTAAVCRIRGHCSGLGWGSCPTRDRRRRSSMSRTERPRKGGQSRSPGRPAGTAQQRGWGMTLLERGIGTRSGKALSGRLGMKSTAKRSRDEAGEHQGQGRQVGCAGRVCRAVPAPLPCACSHGGSYLEQHKCWGGGGAGGAACRAGAGAWESGGHEQVHAKMIGGGNPEASHRLLGREEERSLRGE